MLRIFCFGWNILVPASFFIFFNFILFLNFTILYWFCHISKWIRHRHTRVPHPEPSSLPIPSLSMPFWLIFVCACMLSCFSCIWLFVTLWTVAHQPALPMGFSRQGYWNGLPWTPGDLSDTGIKSASFTSPALAGRILATSTTWETPILVFSSVQPLSHVLFFATPWTAAFQASLSITNSQSLLTLMSLELVMPSNHLTLCHPLLLLPSIFPRIRGISNESVVHIRWPKYWSFSFNISPSNEYPGLIFFKMDWLNLFAV